MMVEHGLTILKLGYAAKTSIYALLYAMYLKSSLGLGVVQHWSGSTPMGKTSEAGIHLREFWVGKGVGMVLAAYLYGSISKPCTPGEHQNSW